MAQHHQDPGAGPSLLACSRDRSRVRSKSQYLFWAKVLTEYRGGPRSLDIHALEATPGVLRVVEATFGWNLVVQGLLLFLILAPAWGTYEVALIYLPPLGTTSGPLTSQGFAFLVGVLLVAVVAVGMNFGSRRRLGRFILTGAFDHSRKVRSLLVLRIETMRTPRSWRLRCRTEGEELAVVVSTRQDRLREALELAGQPFNSLAS